MLLSSFLVSSLVLMFAVIPAVAACRHNKLSHRMMCKPDYHFLSQMWIALISFCIAAIIVPIMTIYAEAERFLYTPIAIFLCLLIGFNSCIAVALFVLSWWHRSIIVVMQNSPSNLRQSEPSCYIGFRAIFRNIILWLLASAPIWLMSTWLAVVIIISRVWER